LVPAALLLAPGLPLALLPPVVPPPFWATGAAAEFVPTVLTGAIAELGLRPAEVAELAGMAVMGMLVMRLGGVTVVEPGTT
jgi:hypothetical protein